MKARNDAGADANADADAVALRIRVTTRETARWWMTTLVVGTGRFAGATGSSAVTTGRTRTRARARAQTSTIRI